MDQKKKKIKRPITVVSEEDTGSLSQLSKCNSLDPVEAKKSCNDKKSILFGRSETDVVPKSQRRINSNPRHG
uniref:Ovule protein n=1 Tax=Rhabditophanes sp. KR3021 TaxID=114890 RepID=A0AC35TV95_9BILA